MSEEERRRICIIMGICPPPAGVTEGSQYAARAALLVEDLAGREGVETMQEFAERLLERYGLVWKERA